MFRRLYLREYQFKMANGFQVRPSTLGKRNQPCLRDVFDTLDELPLRARLKLSRAEDSN